MDEKGLRVPLVAVGLSKGEQQSEAYRKIHPRRVVPTVLLEEDGTAIGEVPAIMRYLDEAFLVNPLPGATPEDTVASTVIAAFSGAPPNARSCSVARW